MKKILILLNICSFGIAPIISATDSPADEATQAEELRRSLPNTGTKKCKCQEKGTAASEQSATTENNKAKK